MATPFHTVVRNDAIIPSEAYITYNLDPTITVADVGKAVTIDTSGPNKRKLAGVDDKIVGRLETVEVRSATQVVGAVSKEFIARLPIGAGQTINIGDTVVGFAAGTVKSAAAPDYTDNYVSEVNATAGYVIVEKC